MERCFLIDRFPEWKTEIEYLMQENAAFQEISQDYEAVLDTLKQLQQSAAAETRLLNDCQELQHDLMAEALQFLQKHFPDLDISNREGSSE